MSEHGVENSETGLGGPSADGRAGFGVESSPVQPSEETGEPKGTLNPPSRKRTRVRTGCFPCKRRHVRCDENGRSRSRPNGSSGQCDACVRLGLECSWPSPKQPTESIRERRKSATKTKSNASSSPADKCIDSTVSDDTVARLGSEQITRAMVDAFFEEVYPCSVFSFLPMKDFYHLFDAGKVPRGLLLSICSLSIKYVMASHEEQSRRWAAEAKSLVHRDMEKGQMTTATLSSLIFCFHQELFHRIFGAAWMTSGIAIRLAFAMRLNLTPNKPPPGTRSMTWAEGESRRRMMWAIYVMDMYVCDGFPEYSNVPRSSLRIQLPCDEESFSSGVGYESGMLDGHGTDPFFMWPSGQINHRSAKSPLVQYIIIFSIRTVILRYLRKKAAYQDLPWQENSTVSRCESALRTWKENLPPELDIRNEQQFSTWSPAQLSAVLSIHLWYCMSYCDLGRLTIFTFVESASPDILLAAPQSYISESQDQCVEHASKMLGLCKYVLDQRPEFVCRDPYVATCLYHAIRITLWDMFRHPSPSNPMKTFTADSCQPAVTIMYRLAGLFSYAGSVMEDTFGLLRRYELQEIMATRLPSDISNSLRQRDRTFKPGPAIFVDASEQSALRNSPEPASREQVRLTTDRGESELFRPPFHSRKDVRIEMESLDSNQLTSDEEMTPPSASWNPQQPQQTTWPDTAYAIDNQNRETFQSVYNNEAVGTTEMIGASAAALVPGLDLSSFDVQNPHIARSDDMPTAVNSMTPGILGTDLTRDREWQFLGDMARFPSLDSLGQSWPPMYSENT